MTEESNRKIYGYQSILIKMLFEIVRDSAEKSSNPRKVYGLKKQLFFGVTEEWDTSF